jgi:folate-dependent phosphoribosylglycinamide formyltransferase PurN
VRVFIVASDEPVFLVPYLRRVIEECRPMIVGVGVHQPAGKRTPPGRLMSIALLALLTLSAGDWLRLIYWRSRDLLARITGLATHHHLADYCRHARIPVRPVVSVNADEFVTYLRELQIDVLFHQTPEILRGSVLQAPAIAVLNRHMSLLPAYRGAWPIFWQFANGEREVGISFHVVDEGIDSGAVVVQEAITRDRHESMRSLLKRLFARAVPLTRIAFEQLQAARPAAQPRRADAGTATFKTPTPIEVLRYLTGLDVRARRV